MESQERSTSGIRIIDLTGLIAGYGLAGLLVRAFWPESRQIPGKVVLVLAIVYLWLGLAMAGPILFVLRRIQAAGPRKNSWAENTWVMIGFYWIGLLAVVLPTRLPVDPLLGLLPVVVALAYRWLAPRSRHEGHSEESPWTHYVAMGLLIAWPLVWVCLLLLSKTLF